MRADKYFADKFGSRSKAKEKLLRGLVRIHGKPLAPDSEVTGDEEFIFKEETTFVSRGGAKLERGLEMFGCSVSGKVFADLGASTGGFTDCLLRHGARYVYCVDVGENQLAEQIRTDERVRVMERTNARYLSKENFEKRLDGVVSDLSFISLKLVLPAVKNLLSEGGEAILLLKPQFECGKGAIGKSGILPVNKHRPILVNFYASCLNVGLFPQNVVNAPLRAGKNVEYVVLLSTEKQTIPQHEFLKLAENFYENR